MSTSYFSKDCHIYSFICRFSTFRQAGLFTTLQTQNQIPGRFKCLGQGQPMLHGHKKFSGKPSFLVPRQYFLYYFIVEKEVRESQGPQCTKKNSCKPDFRRPQKLWSLSGPYGTQEWEESEGDHPNNPPDEQSRESQQGTREPGTLPLGHQHYPSV